MSYYWNRRWQLKIGNSIVCDSQNQSMDMEFQIVKTVRSEPNTCNIVVYNLPQQQTSFTDTSVDIFLSAGYSGSNTNSNYGILFKGQIKNIESTWSGASRVTKIDSRDRGNSYSDVILNKNWGPNTTARTIIRELCSVLDIGNGNLEQAFSSGRALRRSEFFTEGFSCTGRAYRTLDNLVRSFGWTFSVQNGVLQLRGRNIQNTNPVLYISPESGLVGSPEISTSDKKMSFRSLLNSGLYPGSRIYLASSEISGGFEANKVSYVGNTRGSEWFCDCECIFNPNVPRPRQVQNAPALNL